MNHFVRPPILTDPEQQYRANVAFLLSLVLTGAGLLYSVTLMLLTPSALWLSRLPVPVMIVPVFVAAHLMTRRGYVYTAARIMAFTLWLVMFAVGLIYGTTTALSTIGFMFALVAGSLLLDVGDISIMTLFSVTMLVVVGVLRIMGTAPPPGLNDPAINLSQHILFLTLVGLALNIHLRGMRQALQQTRSGEQRFRAIFENSMDAKFLTTPQGDILEANPAACELFGYSIEEFRQGGRGIIVPDPDDRALRAALKQRRETAKFRGELTFKHKDGSRVVVDLSSAIFTLPDGSEQATVSMRDITASRQSEAAARAQTELLQTIIDHIPVMIAFFDDQGQFKFVNREWEQKLGYTAEDCQQIPDILERFYPDAEERRKALDFMLAAPPVWREFKVYTRGGQALFTSWTNVRLSNGTSIGFGQDISERKAAEDTLLRFTEHLKLVNRIERGIIRAENPETLARNTLASLRQFIPCERISLTLFDLETNTQQFFAVDTSEEPLTEPYVPYPLDRAQLDRVRDELVIRADLRQLPNPSPLLQTMIELGYHAQVSVLLKARDEWIGALNLSFKSPLTLNEDDYRILREISGQLAIALQQGRLYEQVRQYATELEDRVTQRTAELEGLINAIPDSIFVVEKATRRLIFCNEPFAQALGYENRHSIQGKTIDEIFSHEQTVSFDQQNKVVFEVGEPLHTVETRELPVGMRHLDVVRTPVRNSRGEIYALIGTGRDLTDLLILQHQLAEGARQLQMSEARYRAVVDTQHEMISRFLPDTTLTFVNPAYCQEFGMTSEELIGSRWIQLIPEADRERNLALLHSLMENPRTEYNENPAQTAQGEIRWQRWYNIPLLNDQGEVVEFQAGGIDITARKQAEEAVQNLNRALELKAQQLETTNKELEAFSYSVSHDLRAPLRAIDGFSRILSERYEAVLDDEGHHYLRRVCENAQRMGNLIDDLLLLSRLGRQELRRRKVYPSEIVRQLIEEWGEQRLNPAAQIEVDEMPPASADPGLLRVVYDNLLTNALKYSQYVNEPVVKVSYNQKENEIVYSVKDNGVGFDMRYANRLFGVFQRLHGTQEYEGTGIGLATVQRIVHRHGGRVWAEAEVDKGAAFYFTLGENHDRSIH
jgi:PAS domain S-box-containing protein